MNVTQNVVKDLMPLYVAGEASEDTRRLVEEYLRAHPEERAGMEAIELPAVEAPTSIEMESLARTRRGLTRRPLVMGMAFAFSYGMFSFRFSDRGLDFVLFRDAPMVAWACLGVGLVLWVVFLKLEQEARRSGIVTGSRLGWMLGGAMAMLPYAFMLSVSFGWDDVRSLCVVGGLAGLALTEALG